MKVWEVLVTAGAYLFGAGIFGIAGYMWWWGKRKFERSGQQREELVQLAEQRGWSYTPFTQGDGDAYFAGKTVNEPVYDYVAGEFRGRSFCCFEYRHRGTSQSERTQYAVLFAVNIPNSVPYTTVKRRRPLDTVEARLFRHGKVVELGIPSFDEAFRVISTDETVARHMLTDGLVRFLTSDPRAKAEPLRFQRNAAVTSYQGRLRPEHVEAKLDYLCDVLDRQGAMA
ncbi:hypothetical protein OG422_28460 [Streptomyces sp. NBC_01525]|uniref:hypothetical protein n=1 Tax=Streptomyces sp. NBC_01525 TaxID=2903893 RepID=UPI00386640FA